MQRPHLWTLTIDQGAIARCGARVGDEGVTGVRAARRHIRLQAARTALPLLIAAGVLYGTPAVAQECQSTTLPYDIAIAGQLDASDCVFPKQCDECLSHPAGEYVTFTANAGELVALMLQRVSGHPMLLELRDLEGHQLGDHFVTKDTFSNISMTAPRTGVYRAAVISESGTGSAYTIRVTRVTAPVPTRLEFTILGNWAIAMWEAFLSPVPILEYAVEVGNASGAANLGVFPVGTSLRAEADGIPTGPYFVRVRARTVLGWSEATDERFFWSTGLPVGPLMYPPAVDVHGVGLAWQPPPHGQVSSYELLAGSTPGASDLVRHPLGNVTQVFVADVPPGVYYVRVRATTAAGVTSLSNEVVVVVP